MGEGSSLAVKYSKKGRLFMCTGCGKLRAEPTKKNWEPSIDQNLADFARNSMQEKHCSLGDPLYGHCVCGNQGRCMGCKEKEVLLILQSWP